MQDGSVEGYSHCILICTLAIYVRQYAPYCDSPPDAYEDDDLGDVYARKLIDIRRCDHQGGRSCTGARVAPAEKFGLGQKF